MKRILRVLLGANAAAVSYLVRGKTTRFARACLGAFRAARDEPDVSAFVIPTISLSEILDDRRPQITLDVCRYEDGMLPTDQLVALLAILACEQPAEVLEIGTFMGHTTRQIAEALDGAIVHTVDLPEEYSVDVPGDTGLQKDDYHLIGRRVVGREFKTLPIASRIRQHFADTATWSFGEAGHPTFFFIDGAHTYDYAKHDSEQCYELCAGRGVFLWHDCDPMHPGVERLLSEWRALGRDVRRIAGTTLAYWKGS
jgi:hypothetical protein